MITRRAWLRRREEERQQRADEALRVDDPDRQRLADALRAEDCGWNCDGHGVMQAANDRRYLRLADTALRTLAHRPAPVGSEVSDAR